MTVTPRSLQITSRHNYKNPYDVDVKSDADLANILDKIALNMPDGVITFKDTKGSTHWMRVSNILHVKHNNEIVS